MGGEYSAGEGRSTFGRRAKANIPAHGELLNATQSRGCVAAQPVAPISTYDKPLELSIECNWRARPDTDIGDAEGQRSGLVALCVPAGV